MHQYAPGADVFYVFKKSNFFWLLESTKFTPGFFFKRLSNCGKIFLTDNRLQNK